MLRLPGFITVIALTLTATVASTQERQRQQLQAVDSVLTIAGQQGESRVTPAFDSALSVRQAASGVVVEPCDKSTRWLENDLGAIDLLWGPLSSFLARKGQPIDVCVLPEMTAAQRRVFERTMDVNNAIFQRRFQHHRLDVRAFAGVDGALPTRRERALRTAGQIDLRITRDTFTRPVRCIAVLHTRHELAYRVNFLPIKVRAPTPRDFPCPHGESTL